MRRSSVRPVVERKSFANANNAIEKGPIMKYAMYASVVLVCCAALAMADMWFYSQELTKKEFEFGQTKLVLEVDGTKDPRFPPHTLSIYAGDQLLAKYKNVGFEKVYASEDNKFFVGVSNHGIPGTAFVVLDSEGNLLREEKHGFLPRGTHTEISVTIIRMWFDDKNPNVEFDVRAGRLWAVYINGSNKKRHDLMGRDLGVRKSPTSRPTGG